MIKQAKGFFLVCICLLMFCTLGACGVTHEYKQPDVAFPAGYRGAVPAGSAARPDTVMALLSYKSFLQTRHFEH